MENERTMTASPRTARLLLKALRAVGRAVGTDLRFGLAFSMLLFALGACSSTVMTMQRGPAMRGGARWVLLPLANYSETPQAGERAAAMIETLLRRDGVSQLALYPGGSGEDAQVTSNERQRADQALDWAKKQGFQYAVSGSVEEWRYKSGLDGEPAVGVTVRIADVASGRVLWSASGTRSGTAGENTSGTALKLLDALVQGLDIRP
jgi:hypothetical protein